MKLAPNVGSDRSWVWRSVDGFCGRRKGHLLTTFASLSISLHCSVTADVSDGEAKAETLAVRFANTESAYVYSAAESTPLKQF